MSSDVKYRDEPNSEEPMEIKERKVKIADTCGEPCGSTETNTNVLDKLERTLSYEEIVSSIEIVKQLQKALKNSNGSESKEESAKNDNEIKEEIVNHPEESLKTQTFHFEACSQANDDATIESSSNDNNLENTDNKNSPDESSDLVSIIVSDIFDLLSSNEDKIKSSNYKGIDSNTHIIEVASEKKYPITPLPVYLNHCNISEYVSNSSIVDIITKVTEIDPETDDYKVMPTEGDDGSKDVTPITLMANEIGTNNHESHRDNNEPRVSLRTTNALENSLSNLKLQSKSESNAKLHKGQIHDIKCSSDSSFKKYMVTRKMKKGFKCKIGEDNFNEKPKFKRHIRTQTKEKSLQSNICGYNSTPGAGLEMPRVENSFQCEICGRKFSQQSYLKTHIRTHTREKLYICEICGYKYSDGSTLKKHMRIHSGERPYQCEICGNKFTQRVSLRRHLMIHNREKPYACKFCEFKCNCNSNLRRHMKTHTGEKPYQCEVCGYNFFGKYDLKLHMTAHTQERLYQCEICGYQCNQSFNLKLHMSTHTQEWRYECEICGYKCNLSSRLKLHMRTHTMRINKQDAPYKCEICGDGFAQRGSLKYHLRIHTGERPYKCKFCESRFSVNSNLKRHIKIHTGERPYKCEICAYQCIQKSTLKTHLRTHTQERPYECELCEYKSIHSSALKLHMRTHTREKSFKCEICGYKYAASNTLKRHMKVHGRDKSI